MNKKLSLKFEKAKKDLYKLRKYYNVKAAIENSKDPSEKEGLIYLWNKYVTKYIGFVTNISDLENIYEYSKKYPLSSSRRKALRRLKSVSSRRRHDKLVLLAKKEKE